VLNTPPRLAVAVFRALVEEAAFTCFAIEQHLGHRIRAQEVWHLINSRI
jgi:erythromycin esterase-like protein